MIFFIIMMAILLAFIIIGSAVTKKIVNPITIINIIYFIWFILGRSGYLGQFKPSYDSSVFILLNIIILDVLIVIGFGINKDINIPLKININSKVIFKWIRYISFFISIAVLFRMLLGIVSGTLLIQNVRNISYSVAFGTMDYAQIYYNSVIYYIYQYLVRGFAFFDLTFSFAKLLKNEEKIPLLSILNFILFIIIMQSRIEFMKMVLFMIIFVLFSDIKLSAFQKKILKRVFIVLGCAVVVLFSFRTINTEKNVLVNTLDSFVVDFSGSNYMFSQYFEEYIKGFRLVDSPLILKYLGGFGLLVEYVLRIIGINYDHSMVNNYLGMGHYIGSSNHYNAFYTIFFEFMNSGGMMGCIIFSIIFGLIIGIFYKRMRKKCTLKSIYISTFVVYIMAMGTYNYVISGIYALMIIVCLCIADDIEIKLEYESK